MKIEDRHIPIIMLMYEKIFLRLREDIFYNIENGLKYDHSVKDYIKLMSDAKKGVISNTKDPRFINILKIIREEYIAMHVWLPNVRLSEFLRDLDEFMDKIK